MYHLVEQFKEVTDIIEDSKVLIFKDVKWIILRNRTRALNKDAINAGIAYSSVSYFILHCIYRIL